MLESKMHIKQSKSPDTDNSNFHVFNKCTLIIIFCVCMDTYLCLDEKKDK